MKILHEGKLNIFTGSGISSDFFPTWLKLIEMLSQNLIERDLITPKENIQMLKYAPKRPRRVASMIAKKLGPNYSEQLNNCFLPIGSGRKRFNEIHKIISLLNVKSIITTNYDNCLEEAHIDSKKISSSSILTGNQFSINKYNELIEQGDIPFYHIHGIVNQPDTIVFTWTATINPIKGSIYCQPVFQQSFHTSNRKL